MALPLEVTYDDFTEDILENRMLVTAAVLLLRLRRIPPRARSRLLRIRVTLDDVSRLATPMRDYGGEVRPQFRDHLDEGEKLEIKPDITWWRSGRCVAVVDAKYKSVSRGGSIPNADAYQMLAYCIAFGIPHGFLVYAKDENERARSYVIRRHGYVVDVRVVDVEGEPDAVLAQVADIEAAIRGRARSSVRCLPRR